MQCLSHKSILKQKQFSFTRKQDFFSWKTKIVNSEIGKTCHEQVICWILGESWEDVCQRAPIMREPDVSTLQNLAFSKKRRKRSPFKIWHETTLMFRSSHFSFLVFGHCWRRSYENTKILRNLCWSIFLKVRILQGKTEKKRNTS